MAGAGNLRLSAELEDELKDWPGSSAGLVVVDAGGTVASAGESRPFPWASVTKLLSALTIIHAAEDGVVSLDDHAGPPGATVRHLLAHAAGVARDTDKLMSAPGQRRIYSNRGIELAAQHLEAQTGRSFTEELSRRVLIPLEMTSTRLDGSPAHGASGSVEDLGRLARECLAPRWFSPELLSAATQPVFAGLAGLLPGFGRQDPNDWGLGFEVRGSKSPHWTSPRNSPETFGHFGQSGSFLWVDPVAEVACAGAGAVDFGPWAAELWPRISTRILSALEWDGTE